jgi:hypothetical protein
MEPGPESAGRGLLLSKIPEGICDIFQVQQKFFTRSSIDPDQFFNRDRVRD